MLDGCYIQLRVVFVLNHVNVIFARMLAKVVVTAGASVAASAAA